MKTLIIFAFLFVATGSLFGQKEIYSRDSSYCITIDGNVDEGFVGDQKLSLFKGNSDTLWTKVFSRSMLYPCISNAGETAIPFNANVLFFDSAGAPEGTYQLNHKNEYFCAEFSHANHFFSPSNDRYYIFCGSTVDMQTIFLVCLNTKGQQIWRDTLDYFMDNPTMLFYKNKVVLYFYIPNEKYSYGCYIYDKNDARVWQYVSMKRLRVWLDRNSGKIKLLDGDYSQQIDLNDM